MATAVAVAVLTAACGQTTTLYSAEVTTTQARTSPTRAPQVEPTTGPPPITSPPTAGAGSFLDSPAAVPNGPGTANTIGSEAMAPLPEPDPADRARGPAGGQAPPVVYRQTGAETLVAHAIVDVIEARERPEPAADIVSSHQHPTERGVPLVFQVLQGPIDGWVEVLLPVRPNGSSGWIPVEDLELTRNRYRIDLDVSRHELTLYRDGAKLLTTEVGIGTGATPTPIGRFYLTELLRPPDPTGVYGPYAYGLSGFSETLDSFNGGPGIIGIHGTNQPELLGTDVSHGCVRVHNDVIAELATFLPLGTPVAIHHGPHTLAPSQPF
ncbi:MAG: L,D-transpeptidase family protein [Actinomycetota bacterium]